MEKVLGIGGFFFRAENPDALARWYTDMLGIDPVPPDYDTLPWQQDAGFTVFSPFEKATDYFGRPEQQWMINFRVRDLDTLVAQLRGGGVQVEVDPEGNPIQLWQPAGIENI